MKVWTGTTEEHGAEPAGVFAGYDLAIVGGSVVSVRRGLSWSLLQDVDDCLVVWDGRADSGEAAGSGVYFYRLEVGVEVLTKRMVLLK